MWPTLKRLRLLMYKKFLMAIKKLRMRKRDWINPKKLPWKSLGLGVSQVVLETKDSSATARLLKIPAGKKVPHHSHNGRELTVVFSGGFTDETGSYGPGDIQEIHGNTEHQPWVREGGDCICLAVTEAPLKFSNVAVRLAQPLIGI